MMRGLVMLTAASLTFVAMPAKAQTGPCDRACLIQVADHYLHALVDDKPAEADISSTARYTENGQPLGIGDGIWATAQSLGTYRLVVPDTARQEVGIAAQVIESGRRVLIGARLAVLRGKITEIEQIVARSGPGGGELPVMSVRPGLTAPLPADARVPGEAMIAAANSYFMGLANATDKYTKFDPNCVRHENGMQTTSNTKMGNGISAMNCQQQFHTGFSTFITGLRDRRFLVDEKTGLVFAMLFFDHAGVIKQVKLTDGSAMKVPAPFDRPYSFQLFETFKIYSGRIREIEAVINTVPYGMRSGW